MQILIFPDRIEIKNPGGIYGRLRVDQLGKTQADTRNPVFVTALEVMHITENRYSGIPTIRRTMADYSLPEPVFEDHRGTFIVTLYNSLQNETVNRSKETSEVEQDLLKFLETPRSRQEIADFLGIRSVLCAFRTYIVPLIEKQRVRMTIPDKPNSHAQRYTVVR